LLKLVEEKVADSRVLELLRKYLEQRVLEEMREWQPEAGTPQGAVISPLLSNIYLDPLDQLMVASGVEMVRYADDSYCSATVKQQPNGRWRWCSNGRRQPD
jgi:RNA-directed DNA polymerase